jgi:hypothetical protein
MPLDIRLIFAQFVTAEDSLLSTIYHLLPGLALRWRLLLSLRSGCLPDPSGGRTNVKST